MPKTHLVTPKQKVKLSEIPTDASAYCDSRKDAEKEFYKLREQLIELQRRLYSEGKQKLLVILQAMDAGGKDSTIRKVFQGVNPQGAQVTSFKKPSEHELSRGFLWRIHQAVPRKGMIGIFNRSQYEDVLVVRVDDIVPPKVWEPRYGMINDFEKTLAETGTTIVKIYLHISKEEQQERFQDRLDVPEKNWKFSPDDLRKREQWDDYMEAYEDALNKCSTKWAPWHIVPADQKWYRNLAISRILVHTLKQMDPQYPKTEWDKDSFNIT